MYNKKGSKEIKTKNEIQKEAQIILEELSNLETFIKNSRSFIQCFLDGNLNEKYITERENRYYFDKSFFDKYSIEGDRVGKITCLITKFIAENSEWGKEEHDKKEEIQEEIQQKVKSENDIYLEDEIKEWALDTVNNHKIMLIMFLCSGGAFKRLAFDIYALSGKDFPLDPELIEKPEKSDLFYKLYSKDWQLFDKEVRFDEGFTQKWAMFVKMKALGMTYDEIVFDSKQRGYWTPLEEKRKGRW